MSFHFCIALDKSAVILMFVPLYVMCFIWLLRFSLLSLVFISLIMICILFIILGVSLVLWTWVYSFHQIWKFGALCLQLLFVLPTSSFFLILHYKMLDNLLLSYRSQKLSIIFQFFLYVSVFKFLLLYPKVHCTFLL